MLLKVIANIMSVVLLKHCQVVESVKVDIVFKEMPILLWWCCSLLLDWIGSKVVHLTSLAGIVKSLRISHGLESACASLISSFALLVEFGLELKDIA